MGSYLVLCVDTRSRVYKALFVQDGGEHHGPSGGVLELCRSSNVLSSSRNALYVNNNLVRRSVVVYVPSHFTLLAPIKWAINSASRSHS